MSYTPITTLGWVNIALLFYLFIHGICTINHMTKKTPMPQRLGYTLFTLGVFAAMIGPFFGGRGTVIPQLLIAGGLVCYHSYKAYRKWYLRKVSELTTYCCKLPAVTYFIGPDTK